MIERGLASPTQDIFDVDRCVNRRLDALVESGMYGLDRPRALVIVRLHHSLHSLSVLIFHTPNRHGVDKEGGSVAL